jgi:hypothetical protein
MGWGNVRRHYKTEFLNVIHHQIQEFLHMITGRGDLYPGSWKVLLFLAIPILIGVGIATIVNTNTYANTYQQNPVTLPEALQSNISVCSCNMLTQNQVFISASLNATCEFESVLTQLKTDLQSILTNIDNEYFFLTGWQGIEGVARNTIVNNIMLNNNNSFALTSYATQISSAILGVTMFENITDPGFIILANITQEFNNQLRQCILFTPSGTTLDKICPTASCYILGYPSSFQVFTELMVNFNALVEWGVLTSVLASVIFYQIIIFIRLFVTPDVKEQGLTMENTES